MTKRRRLVLQHLENISRAGQEEYQGIIRGYDLSDKQTAREGPEAAGY